MSTLLSGVTVGPYVIDDRLDRGGMADVYLARNTESEEPERPVVLRVIEYGSVDADALEAERLGARLQEELAAVDSRVPRIDAWGELDDCCFFVEMEYVKGQDLADLLDDGPLPYRRAVQIAVELCESLAIAHAFSAEVDGRRLAGVVHGDIKPKNIRIEDDGAVRILDFGIAKALSLTRKQTRNVFASAAYASPERLETGHVNQHADLWGVSVVLYQMISGRLPFRADTTQRLEHLIRSRAPLDSLADVEVPRPLKQVLQKALAPDPAMRYATAEALAGDLKAILAGDEPSLASAPAGTSTQRTTPSGGDGAVDREPGLPTRRTAPPAQSSDRSSSASTGAAPAGAATTDAASSAPESGVATQRTVPSVTERPPDPPAKNESQPPEPTRGDPPGRLRRWGRRLRRTALVTVVAAGLLLAVWEGGIWSEATGLEQRLTSGDIAPDAAWERYQQLAALSPLNIGVQPVRSALKDAMLEQPDQIIAEYRNENNPSVREGDWKTARDGLDVVLQIDGRDRGVRARRAYVDGHIDRINGRYRDAVSQFREAARLRPDWPDPYLGLVNTYLYGLHEYGQAEQALLRLMRLDFPVGKRERAQLADAHYFQGLDQLESCDRLEQAKETEACLQDAGDHFEKAVDRYEAIIPWGRSLQNLRDAQQQLRRIDRRIAEIHRDGWRERLKRFLGWQ